MPFSSRLLPLASLLFLLPSTASAVNLILDYSYDTSGFFSVGSNARNTLEQAAADISAVLVNGQLGTLSNNIISGSSGSSTVTVTWGLGFTNPSTGTAVSLTDPDTTPGFAADAIRIYVGWQNLAGTTLGEGGPGSVSANFSGSGSPSSWAAAVSAMDTNSDAIMSRGNGPVISELNSSLTLGATVAPYSLTSGIFVGNLWFDSDTDNNGSTDSAGLLSSSWNLAMTAPGPGQNDFYSVALHEMLHSIGFGIGKSWDDLTGDPSISGGHLTPGTTGTRLSDNAAQEAVMTPSLITGTRKELTTKDLQYLAAIGYNVIPEPGSTGLALIAGLLLTKRRRVHGLI
jgi:hypothetical protein